MGVKRPTRLLTPSASENIAGEHGVLDSRGYDVRPGLERLALLDGQRRLRGGGHDAPFVRKSMTDRMATRGIAIDDRCWPKAPWPCVITRPRSSSVVTYPADTHSIL